MACYGMAYPPPVDATPLASRDQDHDTYESPPPGAVASPGFDCDDSSAMVHPGAEDPTGDGLDQNCDGMDGLAVPPPPSAGTSTIAQ